MDEPQPAIPTRPSTGQPLDVYQRLVDIVRAIRARKLFRNSSATVRWILLVIAVGAGAALLIALGVEILVSLLPGAGG